MLRLSLLTVAIASISMFGLRPSAAADAKPRLAGPVIHDNLAIYFIKGESADGPAPLTLKEALEKGAVRVHETGEVRRLEIENIGDQEVFVNAGDIVKGGRQDRALTASLLLTPRSGRVPIAAFCVERSRWSKRATEDVAGFASSEETLPSREAKLAMRSVQAAPPGPVGAYSNPQGEMWASVASIQQKLQSSLGESIASPSSESSLQLALENETLQEARDAYIRALRPEGEQATDITGFAFAVNGRLSSADIYASNGLFRKLWPKLLTASATEAIASKDEPRRAPPTLGAVAGFLADAEKGEKTEQALGANVVLDSRVTETAIYSETRTPKAGWTHRNYLARR